MIGTGIFTSLGFQVMELHTGCALLTLWLTGGITALTGAMAYAELATRMPRSGGEYHFLSGIYHPALGFISGWVSFIVGFAAPAAAASMAMSAYLSAALGLPERILVVNLNMLMAILAILILTWLHTRHKKTGADFQSIITSIKIIVLLLFILIGWQSEARSTLDFTLNRESLREMISPPFAISLFFVSFAYSGWNASAYITGEIINPRRNLPVSLISGTLIVTLLYMGITWVFLRIVPIELMYGRIEVGFLFGQSLLGRSAGKLMGILFGLLLFSTISSMIITGPRVTHVMGEDYRGIRWFARTSGKDTPARAICIQAVLAIIYILSSTFEQMITYIGFTLNLMTLLTVLGLMILRQRSREATVPSYRVVPYPLLPVVFLLISTWIMVYGMIYRPLESAAGLLTAGLGYPVWFLLNRKANRA
jgi:APA family basic amino acid/polyamine antiporter